MPASGQRRKAVPICSALAPRVKAAAIPRASPINLVTGGSGPPLLLLHGYPQTHVMWRKVAPRLAQDFTVVVPDLRGYGDSSKPPAGESFINYSKRALDWTRSK